MRRSIASILIATTLISPTGVFAQTTDGLPQQVIPNFYDLPEDSEYFLPVTYLHERGLVAGYEDGTFHAEEPVNRAEALAMVLRATDHEILHEITRKKAEAEAALRAAEKAKLEAEAAEREDQTQAHEAEKFESETSTEATPSQREPVAEPTLADNTGTEAEPVTPVTEPAAFADISEEDWFYDIVTGAKRYGVVSGTGEGTNFEPEKEVILVGALRMLFKSSGEELPLPEEINLRYPLPDLDKTQWYAPDLMLSAARGMLLRTTGGELVIKPDETLSRGEMAALIYRYIKTEEGGMFGYASWYGDGLAHTSVPQGEEYVDNYRTAANRTLPFGTILRVTNSLNGKQVDVVVNDRGPFIPGRILDLSRSAFAEIASPGAGVARIEFEIIDPVE
ncbi:hypothetical protein CO046_04630 [Candidatus Peregrinibacteria bacterium CG_4_9_14_0_2_um_filter_53_11]|nr:MAG: hypothetical protein CO046_04630 [Candidatus Peregrinibacteria bacterium CG_4_9_14_0_2_um_filter_53_11]